MGWLPDSGVSEAEIKDHFSQFGKVTEVIMPIDNTPKNFCFVTFENERVVRKLIEEGTCYIGGHKMKIKQVTPNPRDPWKNQGGGWGKDGGYCGYQWGNNRGYGGGMGQGGDQQWGGQGGGTWTTGGRGGGRGGGKMRRGRGMGDQSRPY